MKSMARVLGKSTVLPDIPYSPSMMDLPSISLAKDTLPARNAMGQGLTQASPRPAADRQSASQPRRGDRDRSGSTSCS